MVAIIEKEVVARKKWATDSDMLDILVIAESTPGVLAVNTATSIGYRTRGILGACVATLAVVLPSFLIIFALSFLIDAFQDNKWYKAAFAGIQVSVCVLIINAFTKMFKQLKRSVFDYVMMIAAFGVALFTSFSVIYIILCGGVIGLVYSLVAERVSKNKQQKELPQTALSENIANTEEALKEAEGNIDQVVKDDTNISPNAVVSDASVTDKADKADAGDKGDKEVATNSHDRSDVDNKDGEDR